MPTVVQTSAGQHNSIANTNNVTPATHEQHNSRIAQQQTIMTLTIQVYNCYKMKWPQLPLLDFRSR